MLFSHFLPSVRWNTVICTLEAKSLPDAECAFGVGGAFKPFENSISVSSPPRAAFGSGSLNIYAEAMAPG